MKLIKSLQPLRYGIYCIARRALNIFTEQLQYGIYCIVIVVLELWATTRGNLLHHYVVPNYTKINYVRNCLHRNVALTISMRLSHYRRNFLHRRVMLNYTNSHYVRNCLHRNVGFKTFKETEQLRTEFPASSRSAKFIYLLLNNHVHYQNKPIT